MQNLDEENPIGCNSEGNFGVAEPNPYDIYKDHISALEQWNRDIRDMERRDPSQFIQKKKPVRDQKYLAWIRQLVCVTHSRSSCLGPTEAAHVGRTGKGIGVKCSDHEVVPLCSLDHRRLHDYGKVWFEAFTGINLNEKAKEYYKTWLKNERFRKELIKNKGHMK